MKKHDKAQIVYSWHAHCTATTFLEKCRKVVLHTHFFFWSTAFLEPEKNLILQNQFSPTWKKVDISINPPFFLVNHFSRTRKKIRVCRTTFLEPDFSNQISKNCKNRGRIIKGWLHAYVFVCLLNKYKNGWIFSPKLFQLYHSFAIVFLKWKRPRVWLWGPFPYHFCEPTTCPN